jgi:SagB-type dehydrogenase family enzyme
MSLETFLHQLHFDTSKAKPADWEADWEDAPLPYKLYRGLPVVSLSSEIPLAITERQAPGKPKLREIGHFLWYVYGLTQIGQSVFASESPDQALGLMQTYRRFVPSGGALYPNELYMYLKIEDLPNGVYHYDVAHHRLVLLREGNFDSYLIRALGGRCDLSGCFGTVFVSTMFWKNFFKYYNFSYRLQGLDAGVLVGQMLEVAKRFGFETGVYFQFLDRAVNHLLGLSVHEESVYAVIPLSVEPNMSWNACGIEEDGRISAADLCRELMTVQHDHYVRSQRVREFPMLIKINEASLQNSPLMFRTIKGTKRGHAKKEAVALPPVQPLSYDLASVCRKRYSPGIDFVLGNVSQTELATLLQETLASFSYRNDLDGVQEEPESRVTLYACLYGVEGISNGAYHYDHAAHALRPIRLGDHRHGLQEAMSLDNVNLFQVPLCFHVAGDTKHLGAELGYRGYRIQQMEVGMLVQRLLLAASAIGMGGHPLLGFDANSCDEIYKMAPHITTSLIQIPVGPYRKRPRLEGGLHG